MGTKQSLRRMEGKARKTKYMIDNGSIPSHQHGDKYANKPKKTKTPSYIILLEKIKANQIEAEIFNPPNNSSLKLRYRRNVIVMEELTVEASYNELGDYRSEIIGLLSRLNNSIKTMSEEEFNKDYKKTEELLACDLSNRLKKEDKDLLQDSLRYLKGLYMQAVFEDFKSKWE